MVLIMKVKVNNKASKPEKFTWAKHKKWLDSFRSETIYPIKQTKRKKGKK
jgi:hypothetical protein